MYKLLMKEMKLSGNLFFYILPFLTGALMLIPGWLYFFVILYFCFITIPNLFGNYKSQNDLMFTSMLPVTKKDTVKARILFVSLLEMLHLVTAMIYGLISTRLYPDLTYYFYSPSFGFWGLCLVMLAIFNLIFIPMYFKTAYKFGIAAITAMGAAILFAGGAEWMGISSPVVHDLFKGSGAESLAIQLALFLAGFAIFAIFTIIAYYMANKRFEKVEL